MMAHGKELARLLAELKLERELENLSKPARTRTPKPIAPKRKASKRKASKPTSAKRAAYMREYRRRNKERLNEQARERARKARYYAKAVHIESLQSGRIRRNYADRIGRDYWAVVDVMAQHPHADAITAFKLAREAVLRLQGKRVSPQWRGFAQRHAWTPSTLASEYLAMIRERTFPTERGYDGKINAPPASIAPDKSKHSMTQAVCSMVAKHNQNAMPRTYQRLQGLDTSGSYDPDLQRLV